MGIVLMLEFDEVLTRLTESHPVGNLWFVTHTDEEGAWPGTLSHGAPMARKAKGIYKGSGSK